MFQKNLLLKSLLAATVTTGLAACGGGGSSSGGSANDSPSTETGRFVDSAVAGLEFDAQPSGLQGLTNDNGEFQYRAGDTVTFSVGSYRIGEVNGAKLITPVDISNDDETKTANIARFLQTLDEDGLADNGISISGSTRAKAALENPSDVAILDLTDTATANSVTDLTTDNLVPQTEIVDEQEALAHLNNTLQFEEPVNACGMDTETLTASSVDGKTFGFIRSDEVVLFEFNANGTLLEYQQDDSNGGNLKDGEESTWSIEGASMTISGETFTACATDAYLIFESGDGPVKLYETESYALPADGTSQSFMLSFSNIDQAILTVDSTGGLDYFPVESPISENSSATVANDALELDFDEGGVTDYVYFLKAQGKRKGIYVDYGESGNLQQMGTATIIPTASAATVDTVSGETLVGRNDEGNWVIIVTYNADGTFTDYANDYSEGGEQTARLTKGDWTFADGTLTQNDPDTSTYNLLETATSVYYAEQGVEFFEGQQETVFESPRDLSKTKPIDSTTFVGRYNVEIPTENTVNRTLVINDGGQCTHAGFECDWTITEDGVAEITFADDADALARVWQFANRSESYAFLITHSNDQNDIEPGFMLRQ